MRLALRCDASRWGGVGHVMRCLSLAESGRAAGHEVIFVGRFDHVPWVQRLLEQEGVAVLPAPPWRDLGHWASVEGFDAVHVDHYLAPADLLSRCSAAGVTLSNVEDGTWGRRPADVVVDPSIGVSADRPEDGSQRVLRGERFMLIRAAVRRGRTTIASRLAANADRLDVVVVMGGTDAFGFLPRMLDVLAQAQHDGGVPPLRVLASTRSDGKPSARDGLEVVALPAGPGLLAAMVAADVVVTAAGTTVGEVCCLGLPMAIVPVVENQLAGYRQVVRMRCAVGLANEQGPGVAADAGARLARLLASWEGRSALAERAANLVDGSGAARVLRAIELSARAGRTPVPAVAARPVTSADAPLLLDWRNDPVVRAASRHRGVVSKADHRAWFAAALRSDRRHLLLVEDSAAQPLGSVRWDALPGLRRGWEVSITLAPHNLGRGWGGAVLAAGERELTALEPLARTLVASVHVDNRASMRLFIDAGYRADETLDAQGFWRLEKPVD